MLTCLISNSRLSYRRKLHDRTETDLLRVMARRKDSSGKLSVLTKGGRIPHFMMSREADLETRLSDYLRSTVTGGISSIVD